MNKERRKRLMRVITNLNGTIIEIESVKDEEDDAQSRRPENLQDSEKGQLSQNCSEAMDEAMESIREAIDSLETMED